MEAMIEPRRLFRLHRGKDALAALAIRKGRFVEFVKS
jgi:hypothetical protein